MSDAAQTLIDSPDYRNLLDRISDTYTQAHQRFPDAPISQTLSDPLSWSHIIRVSIPSNSTGLNIAEYLRKLGAVWQ